MAPWRASAPSVPRFRKVFEAAAGFEVLQREREATKRTRLAKREAQARLVVTTVRSSDHAAA